MDNASDDEGDTGDRSLFFYALFIPAFTLTLSGCQQPSFTLSNFSPVAFDSVATNVQQKTVTRSVKQHPSPQKKKKKIYLTFDDGPNKGTRNVLDIVKQENIPVTFFIVGEHVFASEAQARVWDSLRIANNVEICNHSYTHAHNKYSKYYLEPGTVVNDMQRTQDSLQLNTTIVRAPGRNSWRIDSLTSTDIAKSKLAMDSLQRAGFIVVGWDLEWHYDPKTFMTSNTADEVLAQIDSLFSKGKTKYPDNLIILAHDQVYHSSADSLQLSDFIQKLKLKTEYELSTVSNYPAIANKTVPIDTMQLLKPLPIRKSMLRDSVF